MLRERNGDGGAEGGAERNRGKWNKGAVESTVWNGEEVRKALRERNGDRWVVRKGREGQGRER